MEPEPIAHSADLKKGVPSQTYRAHIDRMLKRAKEIKEMLRGHVKDEYLDAMHNIVTLAIRYHDMGKLMEANQEKLQEGGGGHLPYNHVDAGVAVLSKMPGKISPWAALLILSHHWGFPNLSYYHLERGKVTPDLPNAWRDPEIEEQVNAEFAEMMRLQKLTVSEEPTADSLVPKTPFFVRLMLSWLVDCDHFDTASHYGGEKTHADGALRPAERLAALNKHVAKLAKRADRNIQNKGKLWKWRHALRGKAYQIHKSLKPQDDVANCELPVGVGKTFCTMVLALNIAISAQKKNKNLRRIIVVDPYTGIIDQTVRVYRKALTLKGETKRDTVAAHHHKIVIPYDDKRAYTAHWKAPIVVTTAVRFFETLASCHPSQLRRMTRIVGSIIIIDESQSALPVHLWPMAWRWIRILRKHLGCFVIFSSGTPRNVWEIPDIVGEELVETVPVTVDDIEFKEYIALEKRRTILTPTRQFRNHDELIRTVLFEQGPRLVTMNTIQSAAVIARIIETQGQTEYQGSTKVFHLSTALCGKDRLNMYARITRALKRRSDAVEQLEKAKKEKNPTVIEAARAKLARAEDFTVVSTSCMECGLDLSFRVAFREVAALHNALQISGRVNRDFEYRSFPYIPCRVVSFIVPQSKYITLNPDMQAGRDVFARLFRRGHIKPEDCTRALREEFNQTGRNRLRRMLEIEANEMRFQFRTVDELYNVIDADTVRGIVNPEIVERLRADGARICHGKKKYPNDVSQQEIQMYSVSADVNKELGWVPLFDRQPTEEGDARLQRRLENVWAVPEDTYDSTYGYTASVLRTLGLY